MMKAMEVDDGGRMTGDGAWLLVVGATGRSPRRSLRAGFFGRCAPDSSVVARRILRSLRAGFFGRCAPDSSVAARRILRSLRSLRKIECVSHSNRIYADARVDG